MNTGMRFSVRNVMPVRAGRSVCAVINCLFPAAIASNTAPNAAALSVGLQTVNVNAASGKTEKPL